MCQNDWIAHDKRGRPWSAACIVHCLIYTATVTVCYILAASAVGPATGILSAVLFAGLIFFTHWLIDGMNLPLYWGQLTHQTENATVRMVVDQTMHILILGIALTWLR